MRAAGADVLVCGADHAAQAAMGPDPASDAGARLAVEAGRVAGRRLAARLLHPAARVLPPRPATATATTQIRPNLAAAATAAAREG